MADIFDEVGEDLRKERYEKLWKRYGRLGIGVAVAVVLAVAGYQAWRSYDQSQRLARSDSFAAAMKLVETGDNAGALNALADIAGEGEKGYGLLASFERARLLVESGDVGGAIAIWDRVAESDAAGEIFQAVATLQSVMHQLDSGDPAELEARLAPLTATGEPFRPSAVELTALLAIRQGDRARAREQYVILSDDPTVPAGLRRRATQMIAALEG